MVTQLTADLDLYPDTGLPDNVDEIYGFVDKEGSDKENKHFDAFVIEQERKMSEVFYTPPNKKIRSNTPNAPEKVCM